MRNPKGYLIHEGQVEITFFSRVNNSKAFESPLKNVSIFGGVAKEGVYFFSNDSIGLLEVLGHAELSPVAHPHQVFIVNEGKTVQLSIDHLKNKNTDYQLKGNEVICVYFVKL